MKFYIEKDADNKIITKGITIDDAILNAWQIEVTETEFNAIVQYTAPIIEPTIHEPTLEERVETVETKTVTLEQQFNTVFGGV